MWCIDAAPLSRRQVTASLYDLLHPAIHRNLGLIPSLLPDVMFAYWYASLHFVTCVYYAASTARRTENEGLGKLRKARGVTFPVFSLRVWERKLSTDVLGLSIGLIFRGEAMKDSRSSGSIFETWMSRIQSNNVQFYFFFRVLTGKVANSFTSLLVYLICA